MEETGLSGLPRAVTRPLWSAAVVVALFLTGVAAWAAFAELATTMRMGGRLTTAKLSHTVQHPVGGRIAAVHVALFDEVRQGQEMFRLDVRRQQAMLTAATAQADHLRRENALIRQVLETDDWSLTPARDPVALEFAALGAARTARIHSLRARADSAAAQLDAARVEATALTASLALAQARLTRLEPLRKRGSIPEQEIDGLRDRILSLEAQIAGHDRDMRALSADAEGARLEILQLKADVAETITARLSANARRLSELDAQILRLTAEVEDAIVRAPVSGAISELPFDTPDMSANAGAALATIAQPLSDPLVELKIPARYIDQVAVDQPGKVAIESLPRRDAPELDMRIIAVATEAVRDQTGAPAHYLATAEVDAEALTHMRATLGAGVRLSIDMPVSATLTGPSTTFLDFLLSPIYALSRNAFEAG